MRAYPDFKEFCQETMRREEFLQRILERLEPYQFRTLVIGFERPDDYDRAAHEQSYREQKIELGEAIVRRLPGVEIDFEHPELRLEILGSGKLLVRTSPIFIAGRYRKLSRAIPASRWIHHRCRGRGCPSCSHSGTLSGPSVEELVSEPVLRLSGGTKTLFHAMGREDVDACMLGDGRPFVLEVREPIRRRLPLDRVREAAAEKGAYLAEVFCLAHVDRAAVAAVKGTEPEKTYRVWLSLEGTLPEGAAERVGALAGTTVEQLSPRRVMHRRGRRTCRRRKIVESTWVGEVFGCPVWEVRVEAGTYVKELVSGDGGRTHPSLSEVLGRPLRCETLDVVEIHWTPPWEAGGDPG